MTTTFATIDDIPITQVTDVSWALTSGSAPFITSFVFTEFNWRRIKNIAKTKAVVSNSFFKLKISSVLDNGKTQTCEFENLVYVNYMPTNQVGLVEIIFADGRVFWDRTIVRNSYNIRSRLGDRVVREYVDAPILGKVPRAGAVTAKAEYRRFSLFPPPGNDGSGPVRPYKPSEVAKDFIERYLLKAGFGSSSFFLDVKSLEAAFRPYDKNVIEDIQIDGPFGKELDNFMQTHFPNIGFFVSPSNALTFYDKNSSAEDDVLRKISTPKKTANYPMFVENFAFSPREIEVLFEPEIEIRLDNRESRDADTSSPGVSDFFIENVVPVPDFTIDLVDPIDPGDPSKTVRAIQGQYVNLDKYLFNLNLLAKKIGLTDFTEKTLRLASLRNVLDAIGGALHYRDTRTLWLQRVAALKTHYRKTYRINKNVQDRIVNVKARTLRTLDVETGYQSPSPVFLDYAKRLSSRAFVDGSKVLSGETADPVKSAFVNISGYSPITTECVPCPWAFINFSDAEGQGVFTLRLDQDPYGFNETIFPSKLEVTTIPDVKIGDPTVPHFIDESAKTDPSIKPQLSETHAIATIVSCTPAPLASDNFYKIRITPGETDLSASLRKKIEESAGPPLQIRISPRVTSARFIWKDSLRDQIKEILAIGTRAAPFAKPDYRVLESALLNKEHLKALAVATASAHYQKFSARHRGVISTELTKLEPQGMINNVNYSVSALGEASTNFEFATELVPPSVLQRLEPATRAFLLQQVKQENN